MKNHLRQFSNAFSEYYLVIHKITERSIQYHKWMKDLEYKPTVGIPSYKEKPDPNSLYNNVPPQIFLPSEGQVLAENGSQVGGN